MRVGCWPELVSRHSGDADNDENRNDSQDYWCGVTLFGWNLIPTFFSPAADCRGRLQNVFLGHCLATIGGTLFDTALLGGRLRSS